MFNTTSIIYVYIYIIITLILFDLFYTLNEKLQIRRGKKKLSDYKNMIFHQFDKEEIDQRHLKLLIRKLKNVNHLLIYQEAIKDLKDTHEIKVNQYLVLYISAFQTLAHVYQKKDSIYKAFFSSFLSKYYPFHLYTSSIIDEMIMEYIDDKSVYCRENAMLYFYHRGSSRLVINALKKIDENHLYYNRKLLSNDLLKFQGDTYEFAKQLFEEFHYFSIDFQISIINYLRFSNMNFNDELYDMLISKDYDKEVDLAIIRYFGKKIYMPVLPYLLSILEGNDMDVEYKIIVCQIIGLYHQPRVIDALIKCVSDDNWYVRKNATKSLSKMKLSIDDRKKIENISDKYGKQMVEYTFSSRKVLKKKEVVQ